MKKYLLITALVLVGMLGAKAQQKLTPQQRAQAMTDRMSEKLGLTEDQKTQVLNTNLVFVSSDHSNPGARKTARQDYDQKMKAILTEDQYKKFHEEMAARRQHMKDHRQGMNRDAQPDRPESSPENN